VITRTFSYRLLLLHVRVLSNSRVRNMQSCDTWFFGGPRQRSWLRFSTEVGTQVTWKITANMKCIAWFIFRLKCILLLQNFKPGHWLGFQARVRTSLADSLCAVMNTNFLSSLYLITVWYFVKHGATHNENLAEITVISRLLQHFNKEQF